MERCRRGGFGPEAFGYADIAAWARLSGEEPRPWEVRVLIAMDGARRAEHALLTDSANAGRVADGDTVGLRNLMRELRPR